MQLHLLHIGKTGGSALRNALAPFAESHRVRLERHKYTMRHVPEGERFGFVIRDPASRFVSGFNSRLREGRPANYIPSNPDEKRAFGYFGEANALAEALSSLNPVTRSRARWAMANIGHVRWPHRDWLQDADALRSRRRDLFWIGEQESLAEDFEVLKQRLGLPSDIRLPADPRAAHRAPSGPDNSLSPKGLRNIQRWYADEYPLLDTCRELKRSLTPH